MPINNFFIVGINYKKSNAEVRGLFAIDNNQYSSILNMAGSYGLKELFIISTCNRTEIYGVADSADTLVKLLCTETNGNEKMFRESAYIKQGKEAVEHLFKVAGGLDSQILGDYEIVGQLKNAVKFSKEHGFIGGYCERMINLALQSSKVIKNTTQLSGGTVSVSFAAVQYIKEKFTDVSDKNILLIGTGKIGKNTCKNLIDYLGTRNITLINRTEEKAEQLAEKLGLKFANATELQEQINKAQIILVATSSAIPVILKEHLQNNGNKLVIDLSVPCNVADEARQLANIELVNVDELSRIKDETLQKRLAEVPKAMAVIQLHIDEFVEWNNMRKHVPVLKAVKNKLEAIHNCNMYINYYSNYTSTPTIFNSEKIQKVVNGMAIRLKENNLPGCHYIQALHEYIAN